MEILAILLVVSILGNIFCTFLFYRMAIRKPLDPDSLFKKRRDDIAPFVSQATIKPADALELSEVDEELIKKSIKKTLSEGVREPKDDETPDLYSSAN